MSTRLGVIYLPRNPGTPVGTFDFVVDSDSPAGQSVQIDTPVAADTEEGVIVGVVTDMRTIGSANDPVALSLADTLAPAVSDHRGDAVLATVQVFASPTMRPVRAGTVRSATAEEMLTAIQADRIEWPVPAGVVELADGTFAKIVLDGHTLIGPESAHLVVGGLSGQAAKTSYAGVLLRAAIDAGNPATESVAALVFNVKGHDLVNLHLPPAAGYELSEDDHTIYAAMGVPSTPFEDVTVYAPSLPGGTGTRSAREDARPLRWDLKTIWKYRRYFSADLFANENIQSFLDDFAAAKLFTENRTDRIDTFNKFGAWIDSELAEAEAAGASVGWRNHHTATMRRAGKLIGALPNRCGGLLTLDAARPEDDVPVEGFRHGQVLVVDIAGLEPLVQSAVIARTCQRLLEQAETNGIGVDHLVVFADELNMFAPASGGEMEAVKKILTKISATGRYAGISLWGAAQFLSQITPQVRDNAATRAIGILADGELDSGVYGRLPAGQRERIATLPKGRMALKAYNLRGMLTIRFPRPAWQTGKPKGEPVRRGRATDVLAIAAPGLARLTEGLDAETVEQVIAAHDGDATKAAARLEQLREPDMAKVSVERASTYDPDNPWDLD